MAYINGGVRNLRTKKSLKDAVKADPTAVTFYSTGMFGDQFNGPVSDLPVGATLTVVGPDPYSKRDWYASVTRNGKGTITVT